MADDIETRSSPPITPWLVGAVAAMLVVGVLFAAWRGCAGDDPLTAAKRQEEEARKKEQEEKKQADPRVDRLVVQPGEPDTARQFVKPGHWTTASQRMRAIYQDFIGTSTLSVVNNQNEIYPVADTPFVPQSSRPVALLKGRPKDIDTTFLVPQVDRAMQLRTELAERGFGRAMQTQLPVTRMPSYQYHFVILAREPSRYALVKSLDSVRVPWDGESDADDTEDPLHYRVVTLPIAPSVPLSDNALTWTSIAYVLWDEVDPQVFTPEQERALVDWLHWGGQMMISGPDSLDLLKGSFLEPYLPATSGGSRNITRDDLAELNRHWAISGERLVPTTAWSGVKLAVQPGGRAIESTGDLFAERDVGRGRIVVSAMQLAERDLVNWKGGFESLFNACLLRRPNREYRPGFFGDLTLTWADPQLADHRLDARLTSGLRYFARDLGTNVNYRSIEVVDEQPQWQLQGANVYREYKPPELVGGIGAWNDFSATANAAREALVTAAGVEVPGTSFVVLCLAMYLVALVPLNWLVFHAIGRVEWAWIAAPLIALAGTWIIVDRARLDIGFVRAQSEIGLLELQPEYDRGHLSRYTALYTSLSTTYSLEFDSRTALAAPFPASQDADLRGRWTCDFQRYDTSRLTGVFVPSNSTNMVHSEQMFALKAPIRLGKSTRGTDQVENRTQFPLRSAALIRRATREEAAAGRDGLSGMWIGELRPGESMPAVFMPILVEEGASAFAKERAAEERLQNTPRLDLEPAFRLALDPAHLEPGEKRLVARIDEVLPGETITPAASQVRGATLVIAHLEYAARPEPQRDLNLRQDVLKE